MPIAIPWTHNVKHNRRKKQAKRRFLRPVNAHVWTKPLRGETPSGSIELKM
jgi:hypothetical protein